VIPHGEAIERVALFVTCLDDTLFPQVGRATVRVLERAGVGVDFPEEQTCCGQMHFNAGHVEEARALARRFLGVFAPWAVVVTPSGSCAAHVRAHYGELLGVEAGDAPRRVLELTELLIDGLGLEDLGAAFPGSVTYHPGCHSLRLLRLGDRPTRLLRAVRGLELVELPGAEECCGFGGTFAVKHADVSSAMLADKLRGVEATRAEVVCSADSSCLMHIGGGLTRRGSAVRALHLAEVLAHDG
jgi:L-lactate dehydrogenase complex protein LldE